MNASPLSLRDSFRLLRGDGKARHRDIAQQLRVSEGELIAAHTGTPPDDPQALLQATRLRPQWPAIVQALPGLGEVMALTRNASCVHEKTGRYRPPSLHEQVGLVLGPDIDLRLFYSAWAHGFAVQERTGQGLQRSLQFFDATGLALHKVFLRPASDVAAYTELVQSWADPDQTARLGMQPPAPREPEQADVDIDVTGLRQAWGALRDTHDFAGLLKAFGTTRTQALRLAEPGFAQAVQPEDCQGLLQAAAAQGVAIMVFVGNPGAIQIHTGPVRQVAVMGPWLNVLDPGFNLHLREDHIASAWVVRKPTVDGLVSSLELFDSQGDTIAMLFGARKPGQPEACDWRALLDTLTEERRPCLV